MSAGYNDKVAKALVDNSVCAAASNVSIIQRGGAGSARDFGWRRTYARRSDRILFRGTICADADAQRNGGAFGRQTLRDRRARGYIRLLG